MLGAGLVPLLVAADGEAAGAMPCPFVLGWMTPCSSLEMLAQDAAGA